jgi:hypothetical protein
VTTRSVLLSEVIHLRRSDTVLVEADGTFAPASGEAAASAYVQIDGVNVSDVSTVDWRGSVDPVRTSFDAIGVTSLSAGRHTIELIGDPLAGSFTVGAMSNLSVFVHPAQRAEMSKLGSEAGPFDFTTLGLQGADLPHTPLVELRTQATRPIVALGSGTARSAGHDGDGMLGIYLNGKHPGPASSLWTVADLCTCAAVQEPLFTHALLPAGRNGSTVSLDATEFPWTFPGPAREDPAIFAVQPTASLVLLSGAMHVVGAATSLLPSYPDERGTVSDSWCIGSSSGWPDCPPVGTDVLLAKATISIPRTHPGVLMILAKTRVQGDESDPGGSARLWITVDGEARGSVGIQQLAAPFSVSGRTLTASYLAAGKEHLAPGKHVIRAYGRADGFFIHLVFLRDLPLLWFD